MPRQSLSVIPDTSQFVESPIEAYSTKSAQHCRWGRICKCCPCILRETVGHVVAGVFMLLAHTIGPLEPTRLRLSHAWEHAARSTSA
eukprot:4102631-Amphidinium_carterae.1